MIKINNCRIVVLAAVAASFAPGMRAADSQQPGTCIDGSVACRRFRRLWTIL